MGCGLLDSMFCFTHFLCLSAEEELQPYSHGEARRTTEDQTSEMVSWINIGFSPNRFTCMGFLLLSKGCIPGPHDFAFVSGLAFHSGCSGPHDFTLVSHLSPALGGLGRMILHLSPSCLPRLSPTCLHTCLPNCFFFHSGCSGPRDFTCVSHLSPTLGCHSECSGPHDFTLVPHLF